MADKSLLQAEEDAFLQQLLLGSPGSEEMNLFPDQAHAEPQFSVVTPEAGVCIKTKDNKGEKVFINICKTSQMPSPKDITEEELVQLLEQEVPDYRIPMSIGEPHAELDKSGNGCTAYDVMISDEFMAKIVKSYIFNGFFMSVVFEGLENKFGIILERSKFGLLGDLDESLPHPSLENETKVVFAYREGFDIKKRDWTQLKNRKCLGNLHDHHVRAKSKPRIQEMSGEASPEEGKKGPLISEVSSNPSAEMVNESGKASEEPDCVIMREPKTGHPEFLVAEVKLPKVSKNPTEAIASGIFYIISAMGHFLATE